MLKLKVIYSYFDRHRQGYMGCTHDVSVSFVFHLWGRRFGDSCNAQFLHRWPWRSGILFDLCAWKWGVPVITQTSYRSNDIELPKSFPWGGKIQQIFGYSCLTSSRQELPLRRVFGFVERWRANLQLPLSWLSGWCRWCIWPQCILLVRRGRSWTFSPLSVQR